jgi:O-antigen ligase
MIFLLPLSTELNVTDSLGLDFPDEPLLMLLTGFFFVKWMYKPQIFPISLLKSFTFLLILLHLFWIVITCFFSVDTWLSTKYFLAKIWYVIPFVLLLQIIISSKTDILKLALCLLAPMFFVVTQTIIRHSLYAFSFEGIKQTLSPFFRNHVVYSAMLVCLLAVLWCVRKLTPVTNHYSKLINTGLIIGLIALMLSFSRGAWLALIMGIVTVLIIKKKWMIHFWGTAIISVVIFFSWLMYHNHYLRFAPDHDHTIFHTEFAAHLQATMEMKDVSNAERFYRWVAGINMIVTKPIVGFGPNNFYNNYKNYAQNIFKTWVSDNKDHSTVHNYFLLIALEQGLIGLMIFLALLVCVFWKLQKLYHQLQSFFYRNVALTTSIILMMIVTLNFLSDLIETDKIGSLFWMCIGISIWLETKLRNEQQSIA